MGAWPRRIGAALGVGLFWAAAWMGVGALIGLADPGATLQKVWLGPPIGLQPGLLAGALFLVLAAMAASRRGIGAMSLTRGVACGGLAGLMVGILPFVINEPSDETALWWVAAVVLGSMALLGAASAAGSLALARVWSAARR